MFSRRDILREIRTHDIYTIALGGSTALPPLVDAVTDREALLRRGRRALMHRGTLSTLREGADDGEYKASRRSS